MPPRPLMVGGSLPPAAAVPMMPQACTRHRAHRTAPTHRAGPNPNQPSSPHASPLPTGAAYAACDATCAYARGRRDSSASATAAHADGGANDVWSRLHVCPATACPSVTKWRTTAASPSERASDVCAAGSDPATPKPEDEDPGDRLAQGLQRGAKDGGDTADCARRRHLRGRALRMHTLQFGSGLWPRRAMRRGGICSRSRWGVASTAERES